MLLFGLKGDMVVLCLELDSVRVAKNKNNKQLLQV